MMAERHVTTAHARARADRPIRVVGVGGTTREGSSSEVALRVSLAAAEELGAQATLFSGRQLAELPLFDPQASSAPALVKELIKALRRADGVVLASPGYHGSVSGLVKNALDYTELMRKDSEPYLSNRPVGLITTAYGWQAANTTLAALRSITHALRGWPTPYGAAINSAETNLAEVSAVDHSTHDGLCLVAREVLDFAQWYRAAYRHTGPGQGQASASA